MTKYVCHSVQTCLIFLVPISKLAAKKGLCCPCIAVLLYSITAMLTLRHFPANYREEFLQEKLKASSYSSSLCSTSSVLQLFLKHRKVA